VPSQTLSENIYEQLLSALSDTTLDGLLILFGFIAILIELFHPTIVLAVVGIIAIVAGLIGSEIIGASILGFAILAIAAALILIELKLGHGLALMAGAVVGAIGILYLSQGLSYAPGPNTSLEELELFIVVVVGIVGGLYIRWIIGPLRRKRALTGPESLVGKTGTAITDLNPKGEVRVEGIVWRAKSASEVIKSGEAVKVKSIEELLLVVEKV
jgi:membrane-bound serine protease (ClpP class)